MNTWVFVENTLTKQESTQHIAIYTMTHPNSHPVKCIEER